jgi:hypothetical protein
MLGRTHVIMRRASIQILTPEGNIAAEVTSVVDKIIPTARPSRILPVTIALALISGVISQEVSMG